MISFETGLKKSESCIVILIRNVDFLSKRGISKKRVVYRNSNSKRGFSFETWDFQKRGIFEKKRGIFKKEGGVSFYVFARAHSLKKTFTCRSIWIRYDNSIVVVLVVVLVVVFPSSLSSSLRTSALRRCGGR